MVKQTQKIPRRITPTYLHNAGLYYLERYSSSVANFRRVMKRKIDRSCRFHEEQPFEHYEALETVIEKFMKMKFLNDDAYSQTKITSLRRKGESTKRIEQRMLEKGINKDTTKAVMDNLLEEDFDYNNELESAMRFIKRKRLGIYRTRKNERSDEKDLASLARAGYSYTIAKKALDTAATNHQQEI